MMTAFIVITAVLLDSLLGEIRRWHPLVGFGNIAIYVEKILNNAKHKPVRQLLNGLLACLLLVIPPVVIVALLSQVLKLPWLLDIVVLYFAVAYRSLHKHANAVVQALQTGDMVTARTAISYMVSRDTEAMNENAISQATIESVLENGNDAVFASLFWFLVGGAPAVLLHRLVNTLDAMWGYKTSRYLYFGRCVARLDDALAYIPARLVAVSYALLGHWQQALHCWRTQAQQLTSPNAGPVITAGAGALQVQLGGLASYHGNIIDKPIMGCGAIPGFQDIVAALVLVRRSLILWCVCLILIILAG